ncbi:MAG: hemerythrin domain-containing protein [Burkholderiales bacterium]
MADLLNRWDKEHRNFSRLLDVFEVQLALLREDAEPNYELMLDIMDYLTGYSDQVHHPREDLIFAKVAEKLPSVGQAAEALLQQHREMAESGRDLHARLQSILNGGIESRESIEAAGRQYVAAFRSHMDREYRELFPAARKALSPAEWGQIENQSGQDEADPLAAERLDQQYAALRRKIAGARA